MSEHSAKVEWKRTTPDFSYETYNRKHRVSFDSGAVVDASAAQAYFGDADCVDPEELLVGAISNCHMLTFLAVAAKKKFVVDSYSDEAVGVLEKDETGKISVTRVKLTPKVSFGGELKPDAAQLKRLHDSAHDNCFIANSVKTKVEVVL